MGNFNTSNSIGASYKSNLIKVSCAGSLKLLNILATLLRFNSKKSLINSLSSFISNTALLSSIYICFLTGVNTFLNLSNIGPDTSKFISSKLNSNCGLFKSKLIRIFILSSGSPPIINFSINSFEQEFKNKFIYFLILIFVNCPPSIRLYSGFIGL